MKIGYYAFYVHQCWQGNFLTISLYSIIYLQIFNGYIPFVSTRLWYVGLTCMLRGIRKQISLVDRSMLWLKELYIQLFTEGGGCEPLASDAIRVSLKLYQSFTIRTCS